MARAGRVGYAWFCQGVQHLAAVVYPEVTLAVAQDKPGGGQAGCRPHPVGGGHDALRGPGCRQLVSALGGDFGEAAEAPA
jgi:hypothetical protein